MFVIISAQFLPQIINDDDRKLSCLISFYGNAGLASLFEVNWPRRMFDWRLQCQDYMQGESRASQSSGVNTVHCSALLAAPLWTYIYYLGNIFTRTNNTIHLAQQTPQTTPPSPFNLNFETTLPWSSPIPTHSLIQNIRNIVRICQFLALLPHFCFWQKREHFYPIWQSLRIPIFLCISLHISYLHTCVQ